MISIAYTVWGAFDNFRKISVDLDPEQTRIARASRDNLFNELTTLQSKVTGFPVLTGKYLHYGSFARRTKIRPIDDIDMMIILKGRGTTCTQYASDPYEYWVKIDDEDAPLAAFPDSSGYVDSTKILNKIRDSLGTVSYYSSAEIRKSHQAVTLNLKSYTWVFDIVPAIGVNDNAGGTAHYVIPDGSGDWIRTDPRIDQQNMTSGNEAHGRDLIPTMRLLKFWNGRSVKPRLQSYYFETLVLNTFKYAPTISSYPAAVKYFFDNCPTFLNSSCSDPKRLGRNLDANIDWSIKYKVSEAMKEAADNAWYAVYYEGQNDHKEAIGRWGKVFGPQFPAYG